MRYFPLIFVLLMLGLDWAVDPFDGACCFSFPMRSSAAVVRADGQPSTSAVAACGAMGIVPAALPAVFAPAVVGSEPAASPPYLSSPRIYVYMSLRR